MLTACAETEVKEVNNEKDDGKETKQEEKEKDKVYKVGETVSVNGVEFTINKASFTNPNQYTAAKNGKVLTMEVTVKNTKKEQVFVDNTEFAIYDKEGNKLEDYFGYDELPLSNDINAGKQLQGKLFYDVPPQDSYELIYAPSFSFDNKEVKFEIVPQ
jgi:hypothetical protein